MPESSPNTSPEQESLEKEATHILAEARMVLPGVQALFGFQLVAVYNQPFRTLLSSGEQQLHLIGLLITAVSIALLMAPAAYHRQAEPHQISNTFLRLSSLLLTIAMVPLILSITIDCYLTARIILNDEVLSDVIAVALATLFLGLWFVLPLWMRSRRQKKVEKGSVV